MPTGKTTIDTQLQILAHLLISRLEVYVDSETKGIVNNYWTFVSYYNSLRDVGRINNKVGDEMMMKIAQLLPLERRGCYSEDPDLREAAKAVYKYPWGNGEQND